MNSVKQHLRDTHEKLAGHHLAMAKGHRQVAKCFGSMGKAVGMESAEDISDAHEGMAQQHIEMGEFHLQCCKTLDATHKAWFGGMDDDRLVPDFVSSIAPEVPQHVRAIPRHGQRELGEMAKLDPSLENLLKIE